MVKIIMAISLWCGSYVEALTSDAVRFNIEAKQCRRTIVKCMQHTWSEKVFDGCIYEYMDTNK